MRALNCVACYTLVALIVGALFGDRGVLHLIEQRHRAQALARELSDLEAENARLAQQIAVAGLPVRAGPLPVPPRAAQRRQADAGGIKTAVDREDLPGDVA